MGRRVSVIWKQVADPIALPILFARGGQSEDSTHDHTFRTQPRPAD